MKFTTTFLKLHWSKILSVFFFVGLSISYIQTFAVFTPGQTLDPNCSPGSGGCYVSGGSGGANGDFAGVSGGQTLNGGTAASDNLTLSSTSNTTKGKILFGTSAYDEVNNRLGIGTTTPSSSIDITENSLGNSPTNSTGLALVNNTSAALGAQQASPLIRWSGQGWNTTSSTSQPVSFRSYLLPVQGATPSSILGFQSSVNNGGYTTVLTLTSGGLVGIGKIPGAALDVSGAIVASLSVSGTTLAASSEFRGARLNGGTNPSGDLTLSSTSDTTKGKILFGTSAYDEATNRLGIGNTSPSYAVDVTGALRTTGAFTLNALVFTNVGTRSLSIGAGTPSVTDSFFFGQNAGLNATSASFSNFIGQAAGHTATSASNANFLGNNAGYQATSASYSNFFGQSAGQGATSASYSNFLGSQAGYNATSAPFSNFFGLGAGNSATNATNSNFLGVSAGNSATNASYSNFFGTATGYQATAASYSNLFGYQVGREDNSGIHMGSNNIIIGTNISLPSSVANAINLGGILFGTGTHSTTTGNPSITAVSGGKIGIGVVSPQATLDIRTTIGDTAINVTDGTNVFFKVNALGDNITAIGHNSGGGATSASYSNFIGLSAGQNATSAFMSNFLGYNAGAAATNANRSNFLGLSSGNGATNASYSNFLGNATGSGATNASYSNFIGSQAGNGATAASYSNLFGYNVGANPSNNNIGSNNIIIGTNISLPNATSDAINIGGILFGTGTYNTTTGSASIVPISGGRIGIGVVSPNHTLDVSGNIGLTTSSYINFGSTDGSSGYGFRDNGGTLQYKNNGGSWTAFSDGGGGSSQWTDGSEGEIYYNGFVGIGTNDPGSPLDISGTQDFGNGDESAQIFQLYSNGALYNWGLVNNGSSSLSQFQKLYSGEYGDFIISTTNDYGNGQSSNEVFHINQDGSTYFYGIQDDGNNNVSQYQTLGIGNDGSFSLQGNINYGNGRNYANTLEISNEGNFTLYGLIGNSNGDSNQNQTLSISPYGNVGFYRTYRYGDQGNDVSNISAFTMAGLERLDTPQNAGISLNYGNAGYQNNGQQHHYRIYAYKITSTGRVYSENYTETSDGDNNNNDDTYEVYVSWDSASEADGYRILKSIDGGTTYDYGYDTTNTDFTDNDCNNSECFTNATGVATVTPIIGSSGDTLFTMNGNTRITGMGLAVQGMGDSVQAPTNLEVEQTCASGCNTSASGFEYNYRIYSYKNTTNGRIYSPTYLTLTSNFVDDNSSDSYDITVSWDAVQGADGYRILRYASNNSDNYDTGYDTSSTSFVDDACDNVCFNNGSEDIEVTPIGNSGAYLNFGYGIGSLGYGFRDNGGTLEYKNSGGTWATFSGGSSQWGTIADGINYDNGLVGINTTTPTARLSIVTNESDETDGNSNSIGLSSTVNVNSTGNYSYYGGRFVVNNNNTINGSLFGLEVVVNNGSVGGDAYGIRVQTDGAVGLGVEGETYNYFTGGLSVGSGNTTGISAGASLSLNGSLLISNTTPYINFGTSVGSSGYGLRDNSGVIEFKNNGGSWGSLEGGVRHITTSYVGAGSGPGSNGSSGGGGNNIFIGDDAGAATTLVNNSNFLGNAAGYQAGAVYASNFLGNAAGALATNAYKSNFLGDSAGNDATNASFSNFFGASAGFGATNASFSNFFGANAGRKASAASYSNLFGYQVGNEDTSGIHMGSNNIIIGTNISLPNATANAINIGGVLFGIGTYSTTSGDPSITPISGGKIGIGKVTPSYTLDVGSSSVSGIVAQFTNSTGSCQINPTSSSVNCSSDINLKKNITTLSDNTSFVLDTGMIVPTDTILARVIALTPVSYNWNTELGTDAKHTGFIAQQVEQIFPDLVSTDATTGLKSVNYMGFAPYTIAALQEMNLKVQGLVSFDINNASSMGSLIKVFLADISNGIEKIFTKEIETQNLCVSDASGAKTCLTKSQLDALIENANRNQPQASGGSTVTTPDESGDPTFSEGDIVPESDDIMTTSDTGDQSSVEETPAPDSMDSNVNTSL